jgi:hypothetical protein
MLPGIIEFAQEIVYEDRQQMEAGFCIAIEGSWDPRCNEGMHIIDVIDCMSGGVVDFEIVVNKTDCRDGNFDDSLNGMEVVGFKRLLPRWLHDLNVKYVLMDKDSKVRHEILMPGWNVKHKMDTNPVMNALVRFWDSLATANKKLSFVLKDQLKAFVAHVLRQQISAGLRITTWRNAENHYRGDNSSCFDSDHTGIIGVERATLGR